jgi:hypothetical protein
MRYRPVDEKWKWKIMNIHKQKIRNAKLNSTLDMTTRNHSVINQNKTMLLKEERFTEIERENRILYEKMSKIMTRKITFKPNARVRFIL